MRRGHVLALLALAELLGMSVWFSASALAPQLREAWSLSAAQTGWLTSAVQLGFVAGTATAAVLNLADTVPARVYFAVSALAAAACNAALLAAGGAASGGYALALLSRVGTGFFLAGVYPPAMKMIATWYRDGRGFAIGTVVGALTVGKATPFLVHGLERAGIAPVVLVASAATVAAALVVFTFYRDGPFAFERRPFAWSLVGVVVRCREVRLATSGYLGHMWELYAMWSWIAAFLAMGAGLSARGADLAAFAAIAAGGAGCVLGGVLADRVGRERLTIWAMALSGSCAAIIGLTSASPALVVAVAVVWGFAVVADSAQFSALVTELAPSHAVGTALTLQTSLGFLLTMASIQLVPRLVDVVGWRWAFVALAVGPILGVGAMRRLARLRAGPHRLALVALAVAFLQPTLGSAQTPAAQADSLIRRQLRTAELPHVRTSPPALRFGEGRFANVYIRGTAANGSNTEVFGCVVTVEPQLGTPVCVAVPRPAAADSEVSPRQLSPMELDAADLDGDGAPELTFQLSYPGPLATGFSGGDVDQYTRLYVIDASPEPHVAADILVGVESENWRVEVVRGTVRWRDVNGDRHDDIVFTGQTCAGIRGTADHTRCRPLSRQYLWDAATQTWVERAAVRR